MSVTFPFFFFLLPRLASEKSTATVGKGTFPEIKKKHTVGLKCLKLLGTVSWLL